MEIGVFVKRVPIKGDVRENEVFEIIVFDGVILLDSFDVLLKRFGEGLGFGVGIGMMEDAAGTAVVARMRTGSLP
ncbi:MAG: hypothetical protein AAGJ10_09250 [Bacteroidota bacterium]